MSLTAACISTQFYLTQGEFMKKLATLLCTSTLLPAIAFSGGMERTPLPTAFMFETGGYRLYILKP